MSKYVFSNHDFRISKREIMISVAILFISLAVGFLISTAISNNVAESNELYYKALKIDNNAEQFAYGMKTNVGNTLVYGELKSVGSVSFPELSGEYWAVEKITYRYTQHTRTVTKTDSNGKSYTEIETYYEWDRIRSDTECVDSFMFLNTEFSSSKFEPSNYDTLDLSELTVNSQYQSWIGWSNYLYEDGDKWESVGNLRYQYYTIPLSFNATIATSLKDNTIYGLNNKGHISVYYNKTIDQTISNIRDSEGTPVIIFWVVWIILTGVGIFAFIYVDNRWLEDHDENKKRRTI